MKKIMISMPMKGFTRDEVIKKMEEYQKTFWDLGYELVNTVFDFSNSDYKNGPVQYLAAAIHVIGTCDAVYFAPGWEEAGGCKIEHLVCQTYGVEILTSIPISDNVKKEG